MNDGTVDELDRLRRRVAALETENQMVRAEYGRAASQHAQAAELLAACHRLHGTLKRPEVVIAIEDILGSLVSCQQSALYDLEEGPARLTLVAALGLPEDEVPPLPPAVLPAITAGRLFIASPYGVGAPPRPAACMPLRVDGRVTGAIALIRLLDEKRGLTNAEWETLDVIGTHVATALIATRPVPASIHQHERGRARRATRNR